MKFRITALALPLVLGCSSKGFHRETMWEQMGSVKPAFTDAEIKQAYNKKPNLPKAFRLGVYFTPPRQENVAQNPWRWTEADKAFLEDIAADLKAKGKISKVFPIIDPLVVGDDLRTLRLAAAKHQADAILVVSGAGEIDRYINKAGWSYLFILPTFFVPGSQADTLFLTNAVMWDVKNEYLYMTAAAEGTANDTYIAAFGKPDKELMKQAKTNSLNNLRAEIKKMMDSTKL